MKKEEKEAIYSRDPRTIQRARHDDRAHRHEQPSGGMKVILPGRVPSKKNSKRIVRFGNRRGLISSEAYMTWRTEMGFRIRRFRPKVPIVKAKVGIRFFAENRRKWDLSNAAESVMDLLVEEGFLTDDCVDNVPELHLQYGGVERNDPRAVVNITSMSNAEGCTLSPS